MSGARGKALLLWGVTGVVLLLLSAPTVVILGASFTRGEIVRFPPEGLSLRWYAELWRLDGFRAAPRSNSLRVGDLHGCRDPRRHARGPGAGALAGPGARGRCRSTCSCPSPSRSSPPVWAS